MGKWKIHHTTKEATQELASFLEDVSVRFEIRRILRLLASQIDPRNPSKSSGLIVDRIEHAAPEWFRVKVPR